MDLGITTTLTVHEILKHTAKKLYSLYRNAIFTRKSYRLCREPELPRINKDVAVVFEFLRD